MPNIPRNRPNGHNGDGNGDRDPREPRLPIPVQLSRTDVEFTPDQLLWDVIKDRTAAIRFNRSSPNQRAMTNQKVAPATEPIVPATITRTILASPFEAA